MFAKRQWSLIKSNQEGIYWYLRWQYSRHCFFSVGPSKPCEIFQQLSWKLPQELRSDCIIIPCSLPPIRAEKILGKNVFLVAHPDTSEQWAFLDVLTEFESILLGPKNPWKYAQVCQICFVLKRPGFELSSEKEPMCPQKACGVVLAPLQC